MDGFSFRRFTFLVLFFTIPASGFAQAWVAPKGTGTISTSYFNAETDRDYFGQGESYIIDPMTGVKYDDFGQLRTQGAYFDFSYSLTDKLGVIVSIPYLAQKYTAPIDTVNAFAAAHRFPDGSIPRDDGNYHGDFQDFSFRVRYNVTARPFMITPYFEYGLPSNDYLFYSHAIVGRNVNSWGIGAYLGGTLGDALPNAYLQGRYGYAWDEKVLDISRGRNLMELEFGYFFTPSIRGFTILAAGFGGPPTRPCHC